VPESQISKESAYILFYVRKDTLRKQLTDIFPSINQVFPGKPVATKYGTGYVLGASDYHKPGQEYKQYYFIKIGKVTHEIERDEILPDAD